MVEEGEICNKMSENRWFALKVYYRQVQKMIADCKSQGIEFFAPTGVIGNLLFLHCPEDKALAFATKRWQKVWLYRSTATRRPAPIPDREMEVFLFVVIAGRDGLTLLGDDRPEYHEGDLVMVTGGPFKGAEGHIKRIKRDRRLVVTIRGVVAVATTYIHPSLLKKIEKTE